MDIVSYLPPATFGLHAVLWLVALGMLAPHLRRRGAGARATHWLVAILIVSGFGALVESGVYAFDLLTRDGPSERLWLEPTLLIATNLFGMLAAGAVIVMVGSGRLTREGAVFDETEAALQAAETGYRAVIDGAVDGIYRMTPGGRLIQVNPAYAKILGYDSPSEFLAAAPKGGPHVRPERQAELIAAVINDGAVYRFESELRRRDGGTIWVSESVRAITDDLGKVYQLEGMTQDISDRRRAREELKLAAAVFEAAGDGILVTDARSIIRAANPAFVEATGYAPEDLIGLTPRMLDAGQHDRTFFAAMRRTLETDGAWRGSVWLRLKSGKTQQADLSIVAVRGADGRIARYVAVYGGRARSGPAAEGAADEPARNNVHYDALTGLSNRWLFQSRLGQTLVKAQREENRIAAFTIDIDHFKFVNDSLGHAAGDLLIQEMSRRLLGTLRKQDVVARIGGDEFGIIVPEADEFDDLVDMGQRIVAAMAEPFRINDEEIFVTVSVGIAIGPGHGRDAEELMRNADTAMFHAKDQGRNNMQFYTDKLNTRAVERLKIENNLRRAIERNEFTLHYQPQIDIASRRIIGAEALIRWRQPEEGMISPGRFIPVAEETGLIVQIGDWALREACRQIKIWTENGEAPRRVSVNLSFKQFRKPDFLNSVERAIRDSGVDPNRLELELTESMVMHDVDNIIQVLKRIKALGIEIAIDDFGTGYSSLSHIRRLPIDTIKIDRSFVKEVTTSAGDAEIATAIVALAHSLNLKVIAEGVETAEQLGFLSSRRCDSFQGFLASPAVPAEAFQVFQAEWHERIARSSA